MMGYKIRASFIGLASKTRGAKATVSTASKTSIDKGKETKMAHNSKKNKESNTVDDVKKNKVTKKVKNKQRKKTLQIDDDVIEIHDDVPKSCKMKKTESKKISSKDDDFIEIHDEHSKSGKKKKTESKKRSGKDIDLIEINNEISKSGKSKKSESKKRPRKDDDDVIEIHDDVPKSSKNKKIKNKKISRKDNDLMFKKKKPELKKRFKISQKDDDVFEIHTRTHKDDKFLEMELNEIDKHLHNIRTILMHSNASPIQNHNETGFTCGFCVDQFLTAAELKMHTHQNHGEDYIKRFMGGHTIYGYVVKLDITSLRCIMCTRKIYTLELLMDHLETKHDKILHRDINNHILPFKFQSDIFSCVICDRRFDRFKQMQWHMSVHYRNYECDECNVTFINKATPRNHLIRHRTGIFKCQFCTKAFDTKDKLTVHEKFVHVTDHKRNKCTYCDEFFTRYIKKMQHMVEVHGHKPRVVKCMTCDKTFKTKEKLTKHNKRDHMLERNYQCDVCGRDFFDNYDLRRHARTHMDAKPFKCDFCNKGFNRKDNMLEHSRIHTGEHKRFSCDRCGLNFPYMARLKRHTALRHKELLKT